MTMRSSYQMCAALAAISVAAAIVVAAHVVAAKGTDNDSRASGHDAYTIGLFGDMPYNALGKAQYPALLADINRNHVAFSVFDGDLKSGGDGPCADSLYYTSIANFNTLERPLVWLPGDNDWTDCWGRYGPGTLPYSDPLERLDFERQLFTSTDRSLGRKTLTLTRQSSEGGLHGLYSENVRWRFGPVVYIGLNVQGSNDNYPYAGVDGETRPQSEIDRQRAEELARKAADIHWLHEGFAYAAGIGAKGVMVIWQADPNFNNEQHLADTRSWDAYPAYVNVLRDETVGFGGQVALVHGDSHYFKVDKPLNGPGGGVLANFTRVETFGARNTHWVSARIDPTDPNLFVFEPRAVAANAQRDKEASADQFGCRRSPASLASRQTSERSSTISRPAGQLLASSQR
jgi:hypothetical protein